MQLELQDVSGVPLLRTPPEGVCSSSYKHPTPNGVKTVNAFFHGFGSDRVGTQLSTSAHALPGDSLPMVVSIFPFLKAR
jgi:hypothetical protein